MAEEALVAKKRLRTCELVLAEHMEEFVRVGMALREIRGDRLYKADGFERFEDYCRKKWDMGYRYAHNIITSAELRLVLPDPPKKHDHGDHVLEWSEGTVRELKRLKSPTRARAIAVRVLKEVAKAGIKLTGPVVRKHVDRALGEKSKPKPKLKPANTLDEYLFRWTGKIDGLADVLGDIPDESLALYAKASPGAAKKLAKAIDRLEQSLTRVWESLPE